MSVQVLHVLNSYGGGAVISTLELIDALNRKGIKSSLIADAAANDHQRAYISQYVEGRALFIPVYWMNKRIRAAWWKRPLIEAMALWKTWGGYRYQARIDAFIKANAIQLIHTGTIVTPEGAIAAKRNDLPHVWHVRELVGPEKHFRFYQYPRWAAWVSSHCTVLIANSAITAACLRPYFSADKIKVIPNGVAVDRFSIKHHTKSDKLIVGMVGSATSRWKNHRFLIETAAAMTGKQIEFRIYGVIPVPGDPYFLELNTLIKSNQLEHVVKFKEAQNPVSIMEEIDILFHPSGLESFGRIFTEAMSGSIPVVAVEEGGALEIIQHSLNGFLVPMDDTAAAQQAIQTLHDPGIRNAMGAAGRRLAESNYSLDLLAERISVLYHTYIKHP